MQNSGNSKNLRKTLVTISQFVLSDNRENIRGDIHQSVVEIAIYIGTNGDKEQKVNIPKIKEILKKDLWGIKLPSANLLKILIELEKNNKNVKKWKS